MQEFIEKLIGRLEEEREISYADFYEYLMKYELDNDFDEDDDWFYKGLIRAIAIVNQLAEEYNNESVKGDLISRSALIDVLNAERKQDRSKAYGEHECDLIAGTIAMCTDFIKAMPTACNDGWIPCSERLPEYTDDYNVTVVGANELGSYEKVTTLRFEKIKGKEPKWIIPQNEVLIVLAWQPLPPAFEPKGE